MANETKYCFTGLFDFALLSRELIIPITVPPDDLIDLRFAFYFTPTVNLPNLSPPEFDGVQDFRLYVNLLDVSKKLGEALNSRCAASDPASLSSNYLRGVTSYLQMLKGLDRHVQETAGDKALAEKYARSADWSHAFDKLGDAKMGWNGNLHPINYIYNYMRLAPISIRDLMADRSAPIDTIAFSQGPASFSGTAFGQQLPAGRLYYQCEIVQKNPLDGPVDQIVSTITAIDQNLSLIRTQLLLPATDRLGRIEQSVTTSTAANAAAVQRLADAIQNIHP